MSPSWCFMLVLYMFSIGFVLGVNYEVPYVTERTKLKTDPYRTSDLCTSLKLWKKNNGL